MFNPDADRFKSRSGGPSYDEVDPFYYRKNLREERGVPPKAKTTSSERRIVYDEEESAQISAGMRVEHHLFGEGKVLSMEGTGPNTKAVVYFKEAGQKKLILRFARLNRIG